MKLTKLPFVSYFSFILCESKNKHVKCTVHTFNQVAFIAIRRKRMQRKKSPRRQREEQRFARNSARDEKKLISAAAPQTALITQG